MGMARLSIRRSSHFTPPSCLLGIMVLCGGEEHWGDQQSAGGDVWKKPRIYDVRTHTIPLVAIESSDSDMFCSHRAFASDGRLQVAGGKSKSPAGTDIHAHDLDFLGHNRCGAAMSDSTGLHPFTAEGSGRECRRTRGGPTC